MEVTTELIRTLREQTGAGIMDCKKALEGTQGDLEKAVEALKLKGFADVAKRASRATSQGLVEAYVHTGGRVAGLVSLACETDFVARAPEFGELAHELAMQVVAMNPVYVDQSEMNGDDQRLPAQVSLLQQTFIKDGSRTVSDVIRDLAAKVGENIRVIGFSRLALGE